MKSFISYDAVTGEILETGATNQPENVIGQDHLRGRVSVISNAIPSAHYIDVGTGETLDRPAMLPSVSFAGGVLKITGAPPFSDVHLNLSFRPDAATDGAGACEIGDLPSPPIVHLKKFPFKDFEWVPGRDT